MKPISSSPSLVQTFVEPADQFSSDVPRCAQTRGVTWVVKWAAALATLLSSAAYLVEFGYVLMAGQTLTRAVRAGTLEATLPRADLQSVSETIQRRLANWKLAPGDVSLQLAQNSRPIRGRFIAREGDRFSVTLRVNVDTLLPRWVRALTYRARRAPIVVHAEQQMPGAQLRK